MRVYAFAVSVTLLTAHTTLCFASPTFDSSAPTHPEPYRKISAKDYKTMTIIAASLFSVIGALLLFTWYVGLGNAQEEVKRRVRLGLGSEWRRLIDQQLMKENGWTLDGEPGRETQARRPLERTDLVEPPGRTQAREPLARPQDVEMEDIRVTHRRENGISAPPPAYVKLPPPYIEQGGRWKQERGCSCLEAY